MAAEINALRDWRFSVDNEKIAWAVFDREGESANTLGERPLEELGAIVDHVEKEAAANSVRGLVFLSAKPTNFIVGADIREFDKFDTVEKVTDAVSRVNQLLDRIETMKIPVVAAIHGACVGGGLELILACHYRIATRHDSTRVGFPEVKLGIFPGFNGTARSIRQVGAVAAMQNMLSGSLLRPTVARAIGFVDELVQTPDRLRWAARKAVLRKRKSKPAGGFKALASNVLARGFLAKKMRQEVAKKARPDHYPAPYKLIDLFAAHGGSYRRIKREETKGFAPLMVSETSRNLRRVYKLSEMLKAQAPKGTAFKPQRVHVVGAGTMGADIAGWCVANGMEVSLQDISEEQIAKGIAAQEKTLKRRFRTKPEMDAAKVRFIADPKGEHVARADVIIEAIVEKLEIKQKVFQDLERKAKPGAVLASNTSSIMIEKIAEGMADPGRLIGIHFFNPVAQMPLVEVVRGEGSHQSEIDKGATFVAAIGKFPLVVKSVPGFLVNRVLAPYLMGAMKKLDEGMDKEKIDEAALAFGMPMGPIELADTVGLDICLHVGENVGFQTAGSGLAKLVAAGKLGKKSGDGFYPWKDGKAVKKSAEFDKAVLLRLGRELVEPLIEECEACRDEGVVANADLVDAGVIFGTGFAPFRGGPLHFKANEPRQGAGEQRAAAE
ncbi:MAG: hypothetical protein RLZ98_1194 [Pseudomonadota bacterium]|jgi:3-hydroxyacyl-CoA dehydrogenase/enoyl-CoA hydratase/3-hydroxybutyryl-CoA epimerase